jgi:hypothetical protein
MDKPGAEARPGGVDTLDLVDFHSSAVPGILDANGLALSPIAMAGSGHPLCP